MERAVCDELLERVEVAIGQARHQVQGERRHAA